MKKETLELIKRDYERYKEYEIYKRQEYRERYGLLSTYTECRSFYDKSLKYKKIDKEKLNNLKKFRNEVMIYCSYVYNTTFNDDKITNNIITISLDDILQFALNLIFKKYVSQIDNKDTNNIYFNFGDINDLSIDELEDIFTYFGPISKDPYFIFEEESHIYKNLEQEETIIIPKEEISKFESEHDFVYQTNMDEYQFAFYMTYIEFPKIRADFLLKAFDTNQEEAKKYVLKKYSLDAQYNQLEEYEKRFGND